MGCPLGGLPLGQEIGALGMWPPPVSLVWPRHAMEVGALPTSCGVESDSLEIRLCIGQSWYSTLDLCWCLSAMPGPSTCTCSRSLKVGSSFKMCMTIPAFQENAGGHGHLGQSAIVTSNSKAYSSDGG